MKPALNRPLFTRFPRATATTTTRETERRSVHSWQRVSRGVSRVNTLGIDMVPREKGHLHQEWR